MFDKYKNSISSKIFEVKTGDFFRIESIEGPQVGDLNLFQLNNLDEKFYSGARKKYICRLIVYFFCQ